MEKIRLLHLSKAWGRYLVTTLCALLLGIGWASAQVSVKGKITSSTDNSPLPGVNIVLKGTSIGTITDINGAYSIEVPDGNTILVISSMGFLSEEITVGDQTQIDMALAEDITGLDEVVVIGYGAVRKKEVTGAVARVSADELSRNVTSDVGSALQGQVAGVTVTASGEPGERADILIRGISTIGNNSPLFVIDGVPYDYDPGISPSEIESVDILKDAASCAIYGTRGAAGVILITTKQGKAGSLKISANASYGISKIHDHMPLMNAQENTYFELTRELNVSGFRNDLASIEEQRFAHSYHYDTDIRDAVFVDNAATRDYSLNITGGKENITYNISTGFYDQDGTVVNSAYKRLNTRANTTYEKGRWKVQASIGMSQDDRDRANGGLIGHSIRYKPNQQDLSVLPTDETITINNSDQVRVNWLISAFDALDNVTSSTALGNLNFEVDIYKGLSFSSRAGVNNSYSYRKRFQPYREILTLDETNISSAENSYVEAINTRRQNMTWDALLKYEKQFGDHKITAQAGYTVEEMSYVSVYARGEGVIDNRIQVLDGTSLNFEARSTTEHGGDPDWEHRRIGTLGRVLYTFKDGLYNLNVSGRYDGSAKFSPDYRWGFFPSISAAWNISDEVFWAPINHIAQDVKIRVSRGTTGNENFDPYTYSPLLYAGDDYAFGSDADDVLRLGLIQRDFSNSKVKWETSVMWNGGIDMYFLDNRVSFTAEVYSTQKEDMLFPVLVPGSASGQDDESTWLNVGNMTNKGYELALGYRAYDRTFKWGISGTYAANKNEVTHMTINEEYVLMTNNDLVGGTNGRASVTSLAEGHEVGAFFLYTTDGIIDTHEELAAYQKIRPDARMGDLKYVDTNGDGEITDADRQYAGSALPDFTAGLVINAEFKGFDLLMQWYASVGHEIMNGAKATAYGFGRHQDQVYQWSPNNPVTPIPRFVDDIRRHDNYAAYTDLWLEDGSFLRLKNVSLGYTLPKGISDKMRLDKLRVYISAQNAITLTNYDGYDPEVGSSQVQLRGLDRAAYPISTFYLMGINLNF